MAQWVSLYDYGHINCLMSQSKLSKQVENASSRAFLYQSWIGEM